MTRFVSRIAGIEVGADQVDGVRTMYQSCVCSKCGGTMRVNTSKTSPLPGEVIFKKMRQAGWVPDKRGHHLCSSCAKPEARMTRKQEKQEETPKKKWVPARAMKPPKPVTIRGVEYPSMNAAARAFDVNVSHISSAIKHGRLDEVGLRPKPAAPTPTTPTTTEEKPMTEQVEILKRVMSREEKRAIIRRLDEVYDTVSQRYVDDWTDHRVAQGMNLPRAWITELRDEVYGPAGSNDEMDQLSTQMKDMLARLEDTVEQCLSAAASAEKLNAEVKSLEIRVARLREAVGPQAGRT